jgi:hypothetical protein
MLENNRLTPNIIKELKENEIFVFGSNLSGIHGKGAAKFALKFGAEYGNPVGPQGQTYAIPTKNERIKTLPLLKIEKYVKDFIEFAISNEDKIFLVTEIGCGLAGYNPSDIAPLFSMAVYVNNIHLPKSFWEVLL